jgi:serine/threonine protein kinase
LIANQSPVTTQLPRVNETLPFLNTESSTPDGDDDLFERVAADFLAKFRLGATPDAEAYATQFPELAEEIRELFPTMLAIERVKLEREHSSGGQATLGAKRIERLGDFHILREIGRGGMGIVFEAEQESLERHVALKVLPPNALHDDSHVRRFHREARTAAALHHTNIVPVFGVGFDDGLHYYVMQLIDGAGLDQRFKSPERKPMPPVEAATIVRQVADAVQYAHDHHILHRDIKPANVLLDRGGNVWITDFGLAQALERDETRTDHVAGTLRYMAPERLRGVADERSDQYSLGITLYELATGSRAFEGSNSGELLRSIADVDPIAARTLVPSLPRDLETIIQKSIAKDAAHRYPSVRAFADDLTRFCEGRPIQARPVGAIERTWRWSRRNPALAAALGSVAALIVLIGVMLSVGYYRAKTQAQNLETAFISQRAALQSERAALDGERKARQSAESITQLALLGLDSVFDSFAPSTPYTVSLTTGDASAVGAEGSDAENEGEALLLPAQSRVSPEAAAALEQLLPIYEQLAEETGQDPRVQRRAASAQHRLGIISRQLGNNDAALAALLSAEKKLEQVSKSVSPADPTLRLDYARLLNDLGELERQMFRGNDSEASHARALALLASAPREQLTSDELLELARTHFQLGKRQPFFGGGPGRNNGGDNPRDRNGPGRDNRPPQNGPPGQGFGSNTSAESTGSVRPESGGEPLPEFRPPGNPNDDGNRDRDDDRDGNRGRDDDREDGRGRDSGGRDGVPPQGGGPAGRGWELDQEYRQHLETAISILIAFPDAARDTRVTLLLAQCYRERSKQWRRDETELRDRDRESATVLLSQLIDESPQVREFRFELAETQSDFDPLWWPEDRLPIAEERLTQALTLAVGLVADAADIPAYQALETQVREKLASVFLRTQRREQAREMLTAAIDRQNSLARQFPESFFNVVWAARLSLALSELLVADGNSAEAIKLLKKTSASVEPYVAPWERRDNPGQDFTALTLAGIYFQLGRLLDRSGDAAAAAEYREKAEKLGPSGWQGRRPPFDRPREAERPTTAAAPNGNE